MNLHLKCAIQHIGSIDIETTNNTNIDEFILDETNNDIKDNINFYFKIRNLLLDEYNRNSNDDINNINDRYNDILYSEKDSWFLQYTTSKPIPIKKINKKNNKNK